jgi:hypothetical protein
MTLALAICLCSADAWADDSQRRQQQITGDARQGFVQILDLWRQEQFDDLYDHLVSDPGSERWDFVNQLNYSARRPACCWEMLQDVAVVYLDDTTVLLTAKLGIEVEGVGTRFVTRSFRLVKQGGIWRLTKADILSLAEPNMQRIPREILNRPY